MNLTKENIMTMYVAMGGVNHEGEDADSVKVFVTRDAAVEYGKSLVSSGVYDYYAVVDSPVN